MKPTRATMLLLAVLMSIGSAKAQDVMLVGIGARPCAHWTLTPVTRAEGEKWILGFWSGLNYSATIMGSRKKQVTVDPDKMLNEVGAACARNPAQSLADTVWLAFLSF